MTGGGGIITTAVRHLMAAGVTGEALLAAIADLEAAAPNMRDEAAERRRARDREYQAARRQMSAESADVGDAKEKSPKPPKEKHPPLTPKGVAPRRLPDDFVMPDDWKAWAREKRGWSAADIETEAENFADYWQARGAGATKLDWRKAWQTWVRGSKRPDGTQRNAKPLTEDERRTRQLSAADLYDKMGRTEEAAEIRRRWATGPPSQPFGNVVAGVMARVGKSDGKA